jgi:uncharacterized spore protein YtfJ
MTADELFSQTRDVLTVKRVFGEPYEHDGVTIIPVARIAGGGGGGEGTDQDQHPSMGGGFGMRVMPAGLYVLKEGTVTWRPAVDINRIISGAQLVVALFLLTFRTIMKARMRASTIPMKQPSLLRKSMLLWRRPTKRH